MSSGHACLQSSALSSATCGTLAPDSLLLQAPAADLLSELLSRLPLVSNVAILSPHGFFGQKDVLGKPDTGGQVTFNICVLSCSVSFQAPAGCADKQQRTKGCCLVQCCTPTLVLSTGDITVVMLWCVFAYTMSVGRGS